MWAAARETVGIFDVVTECWLQWDMSDPKIRAHWLIRQCENLTGCSSVHWTLHTTEWRNDDCFAQFATLCLALMTNCCESARKLWHSGKKNVTILTAIH